MSYKQIISIGLDLTWGGGEFEYRPEDLEKLTPQQLGFIQEMLLHFIYETERLKRQKQDVAPSMNLKGRRMSDMKCPFCQQELDCMGKYTDGSSKWLCNKCDLFGDKKLFDEIIAQADKAERLQKAVDVAEEALKYARQRGLDNTATLFAVGTKADKALIEIKQLTQGDK